MMTTIGEAIAGRETETLAMIEEVGVGARDVGAPVLWFTVSGDGWGSLQVFNLNDPVAIDLLGSVREVHDLNGRMCVVDGGGTQGWGRPVQFKRLLRAPRP
jgi:hypothetical protein